VLKEDMFSRYILNSLIVSTIVVVGNIIFSTMVAYAFARRKFFGKNVLFSIVLATMMIPPQVTIIPIFIIMKNIGWIDTYFALTVPMLVTPFSIFLLKQYIEQLPIELEQAAYVDGANTFQILFKIIFPLSKPAIAVMAINTFIATWNDLFYPLVMTNSREMRTVQVGLALYQKLNQIDWPRLMAASSIIGLPVIIIFLAFQKHIISGITKGALKG
jgi:multiple sugar transport system permease protein